MKRRYKAILFFALFTGLLAAFLLSSFFNIKEVTVSGNKQIAAEVIIKSSGLMKGTNIFKVNLKKSMDKILKNPYIHYIKMKRKLPGTVTIDVVEREAMATVPYVGSWLVVGSDGTVLEVKKTTPEETLPVLEGLEFKHFEIGQPLELSEKQFNNIVKVIQAVQNAEFAPMLSSIEATDSKNIVFHSRSGIKILIGDMNDLNYKVKFSKAILEDLTQNKGNGSETYTTGVIDMTHGGNPIFKIE